MKKKILFLFAALLSTTLFSQELQNSVNKINNDKIIISTQLNERFFKYSKENQSGKSYITLADIKNNKEILFNKYVAPFEISGKFHIPIQENNHGFYLSSNLKEYLFINKNYKKTFPYCNGAAFVLDQNNNFLLIDMKGNVITDQVAFTTGIFGEGLAPVKLKDGKTGYMNPKGKLVLELNFDLKEDFNKTYATRFNNGYAIINDNKTNEYFVIDKKGKYIKKLDERPVSDVYCNIVTFVVPAEREGLYAFGFMKTDGNIVFPPKYRFANEIKRFPSFSNGRIDNIYCKKTKSNICIEPNGNAYKQEEYFKGEKILVETYFENLKEYEIGNYY